jgi:hypothetical protein
MRLLLARIAGFKSHELDAAQFFTAAQRLMCAGCRDGAITRTGMLRLMRPIRHEIYGLLPRGLFSGRPKLAGLCNPVYDHRDWLCTFLHVKGVDPTDTINEHALLPAVPFALCAPNDGIPRSRFVATIWTIFEMCHRQSRNSF